MRASWNQDLSSTFRLMPMPVFYVASSFSLKECTLQKAILYSDDFFSTSFCSYAFFFYIHPRRIPTCIDLKSTNRSWIKNIISNYTLGSHCAVNRAYDLCPAVQHDLLPIHADGQRQQGVLHPEREGRSWPCSESSHDPQSFPLHANAGKDGKKTEFE